MIKIESTSSQFATVPKTIHYTKLGLDHTPIWVWI